MGIKRINIEIPKMNYKVISVYVKSNDKVVKLDENDLMFMTVKEHSFSKNKEIEKALGNGITYNDDTGAYDITIEPEDTKNMEIGKEYGYDITIYFEQIKPIQKIIGEFKITDQYTDKEVN